MDADVPTAAKGIDGWIEVQAPAKITIVEWIQGQVEKFNSFDGVQGRCRRSYLAPLQGLIYENIIFSVC